MINEFSCILVIELSAQWYFLIDLTRASIIWATKTLTSPGVAWDSIISDLSSNLAKFDAQTFRPKFPWESNLYSRMNRNLTQDIFWLGSGWRSCNRYKSRSCSWFSLDGFRIWNWLVNSWAFWMNSDADPAGNLERDPESSILLTWL